MDRPIPIVICAVLDGGRILLMKRNKEPFPGLWGLLGGKIEHGEHFQDTSLREIKEETSLDVDFNSFRGVVSEHIIEGEKITHHLILFVCNLNFKGGNMISSEEGELKWFDLESLEVERGNMIPSDYHMIKEMITKNSGKHFVSVITKNDNGYFQERFEPL